MASRRETHRGDTVWVDLPLLGLPADLAHGFNRVLEL
jgi:hypothetical protein